MRFNLLKKLFRSIAKPDKVIPKRDDNGLNLVLPEIEHRKMTHYGPSSARTFNLVCAGCGQYKLGHAMEIGIGVWKQLLGRISDKRMEKMFEPFSTEGAEALIAFCPVCQKVYDPVEFMFVPEPNALDEEDEEEGGQRGRIAIPLAEFIKQIHGQGKEEKGNGRSTRQTEESEQDDSQGLCEHREHGCGSDPER